jgi:drug/metabolite transporter (DMT)-like permease
MRWTLWIAFAALSILSGTSWAIPAESAERLPALEQQGLLFGVIGVIALLFAGRAEWSRGRVSEYARLAAAAVGFFGVPIVVAEYARGSVPAISRSALFALVPVVVVLAAAAGDWTEREERDWRRFLTPALAGLGGLLLLLPFEFSRSARGWGRLAVVCVAVVLVGLASVWLYRMLRGFGFACAMAVVGLSNAAFLLASSAARDEMVWRASDMAALMSTSSLMDILLNLSVDVAEVLLLAWLLREMQPVRFAARYLVIPLVTVLEGYVLVRPELTIRMGSGTVLLAAGAAGLLFLKAEEGEQALSLR